MAAGLTGPHPARWRSRGTCRVTTDLADSSPRAPGQPRCQHGARALRGSPKQRWPGCDGELWSEASRDPCRACRWACRRVVQLLSSSVGTCVHPAGHAGAWARPSLFLECLWVGVSVCGIAVFVSLPWPPWASDFLRGPSPPSPLLEAQPGPRRIPQPALRCLGPAFLRRVWENRFLSRCTGQRCRRRGRRWALFDQERSELGRAWLQGDPSLGLGHPGLQPLLHAGRATGAQGQRRDALVSALPLPPPFFLPLSVPPLPPCSEARLSGTRVPPLCHPLPGQGLRHSLPLDICPTQSPFYLSSSLWARL